MRRKGEEEIGFQKTKADTALKTFVSSSPFLLFSSSQLQR